MANKHLKKQKTEKAVSAPAEPKPAQKKTVSSDEPTIAYKPVDFRPEPTAEQKAARSAARRKNAAAITLSATGCLILLAAIVFVWYFRERLDPDRFIISTDTAAVAEAEYLFDSGSGQVFAPVGSGLAVATSSGLELLGSEGENIVSKLLQMEEPAIASCDTYAVYYDIGGTNIAAADLEGNVTEFEPEGAIISVTVSRNGYMTLTTRCTGYRALVVVYDPTFEIVYKWYSSSAWVMSAVISPDNRKLAILTYTSAGSEVRIFDLSKTDQQATFSVSDTILIDVYWFSPTQLCAYSTQEALFFTSAGDWTDTYSFSDRFITGFSSGGEDYLIFALSPYQAGTTSTLVSLDANGRVLGSVIVDTQIVSLAARDDQVLLLCPDGALLYSSQLQKKGELVGLPGFKSAILTARDTALLIAANYAEVYKF